MRLTNKQLNLIVDEIYSQVSEPGIKENEEILSKTSVPDDEYILAVQEYKQLEKLIEDLEKRQKEILDQFCNGELNGYKFRHYNPQNDYDSYILHRKKQLSNLKEYPCRGEIEKTVILSEVNNLKELITGIVEELKRRYA